MALEVQPCAASVHKACPEAWLQQMQNNSDLWRCHNEFGIRGRTQLSQTDSTLAVHGKWLGGSEVGIRRMEFILEDSQVEDGTPLLQAALIFGQGAKGSRWLMAHW